jgi:hypothetical protein
VERREEANAAQENQEHECDGSSSLPKDMEEVIPIKLVENALPRHNCSTLLLQFMLKKPHPQKIMCWRLVEKGLTCSR